MEPETQQYPVLLLRAIRVITTLAALVILIFFFAIWFGLAVGGGGENAFPIDFAPFWGTAQLALEGRAADAFVEAELRSVLRFPDSGEVLLPWLYPPTWALVVTPFGLLPFWAAWIAFAALSIAVYLLALKPWSVRIPGRLGLVLASPLLLISIVNSNNGLLMAGLLVMALWQMRAERPVIAGLLIGLLSAKPTLGLLLPLAFLAGGYWRTFIWSGVFTVTFALLATAVFGWGNWEAFFNSIGGTVDRVSRGEGILLDFKVTWYGLLRHLDVGHDTAVAVQIGISIVMVGVLAWFWSTRAGFPVKAAALLVAVPLAAPYAFYYELAFTLAGAVVWTFAGHGRRRDEIAVLIAVWLLPLLVPLKVLATMPLFAAPICSVLLVLILLRAERCERC